MKIAIIGDFDPERLSHKSTDAALHHAAAALSADLNIEWLKTTSLETEIDRIILEKYNGIFCAPGGPYESMSGALKAIQFAREHGWPFIGT